DLRVRSLAFDPKSRTLAVVLGVPDVSSSVHWWDLRRNAAQDGSDAGLLYSDNKDWWADPALSPDLRYLACTGHEDTAGADYILLMDRNDKWKGRRTLAAAGDEYIVTLGFSPDGRWLAAAVYGERDGAILRWDVAAALRRPVPKGLFDDIIAPLPSPALALGTEDAYACLTFSPDGRRVAAARVDRTVGRWEFATGRPLPVLKMKGRGRAPIRRLAFSPDGHTLAVAAGPAVTLFGAESGAVQA